MATKECKFCGVADLHWKSAGDKYWLVDANEARHECLKDAEGKTPPPVTSAKDVHRPGLDDELKNKAISAIADAMSVVYESFTGTAEKIGTNTIAEFDTIIRNTIAEAEETFRQMMPVQHEIIAKVGLQESKMEGIPHKQLQRVVNWLNLREHVWLAGPAGSGKSYGAEMAAKVLDLPCYVLPCGMSTSDWSLLGFKSPATGEYIPGALRKPYEEGGVFVLDEIDNTPASVLTTINSALSGSHYQFPDADVKRHDDFVVVGCANTWGTGPDRIYCGRQQIDGATLSRFRSIEWGYDEDAEFDWAGRDQTKWVEYVQGLRNKASSLGMRVVISPRASIVGAKGIRNGLDWDMVADDCIFNAMSEDDSIRLQQGSY